MGKLDKLEQIMELLQNDTIRPQELEKFLMMVLSVISKASDSFKSLSEENLEKIKSTLAYLSAEHNQVLKEVDFKNLTLSKEFKKQIKEVEALLRVVQKIEVRDGKDGKDADENKIISEVLSKIILPKEFILAGKEIVEKVNDLPTDDEDLKIDAVHIKNLPKEVQKHSFAVQRNIAWYDETTLIIENPLKVKFQGSGVQASVDNEGTLIVTVNGGSGSATFEDEAMTDSGDHTTFTISFTPTSGTLLVINENTGQAVPTSSYSNVATSVTFNQSQEIDDGGGNLITPTFRARYSH